MEYIGLYIIVFITLVGFVVLMSIGVMRDKKPIAGSCGGLNTAMRSNDGKCLTCGTTIDEKSSNTIRKKLEK